MIEGRKDQALKGALRAPWQQTHGPAVWKQRRTLRKRTTKVFLWWEERIPFSWEPPLTPRVGPGGSTPSQAKAGRPGGLKGGASRGADGRAAGSPWNVPGEQGEPLIRYINTRQVYYWVDTATLF